MYCNLKNIVIILEKAFLNLKQLENKDIILAIGNTGCGKSTMLTSLMYGPQSLKLQKIDYEINVPHENGFITKLKKK